jgi:hypothetical protein
LAKILKISEMRRLVFIFIMTIAFVAVAGAQDYKTSLGLRLGTGSGFTVKHFINSNAAIEGLLLTRWHGFDITGLYEVHNIAFDTDHLNWFYGGGAHIGFYDGDYVEWGSPGTIYNVFGIDGIIGLEYSFPGAPINMGLDLKPAVNLIGYTGFWAECALSVRYIF